jgi:hypothetical protein
VDGNEEFRKINRHYWLKHHELCSKGPITSFLTTAQMDYADEVQRDPRKWQ